MPPLPPHIALEDTRGSDMKDTDSGTGTGLKDVVALEETSLSVRRHSGSSSTAHRQHTASRSHSPVEGGSIGTSIPKHSRSLGNEDSRSFELQHYSSSPDTELERSHSREL